MGEGEGAKSLGGTATTVFFSYSREDQKYALPIINFIQEAGYAVWWDGLLAGGERFSQTTATALANARAVVVLWSKTSIHSHWVHDEATEGRDRHCLVPLSLDGAIPPLGFRQFQTIDLSHASHDPARPQIRQLIEAVAALHDRPPPPLLRTPRGLRVGRRQLIATSVTAAGLTVAAVIWRERLFGVGEAPNNTIVVLPFANVSGSPAQDYFPDGLSAEIRAALARNAVLRVVGQVSSNVFKSTTEDAKTIARKLGVAFILDGSARLAANRVRVSAELIQGASGFSRWAQTFDRAIDDIFAVQSEIAAAVTAALTREVAKTTPVDQAVGTTNILAFDAYLRGRADFALAAGPDTDHSALAHFEEAIAYDPKFGAAYAARSRTLIAIANQLAAGDKRKLLCDEAIAAAKQSAILAPELADAPSALAFALVSGRLDIQGARAPYERSYALGRGDPDVLGRYALYCAHMGRLRDAEAAIDQARELDPLNPRTYWDIGSIQFVARRYGDAVSSMDHALALDPRMANVNGYRGYCFLMMGKLDEAERAFQEETSPVTQLPGLAIIAKRRENEAEAHRAFAKLVAELGDNGLYQQAEVQAQWGDDKAAVATLNQAWSARDPGLFLAGQDPLLDPIRANSDFSTLLRNLGFH
jgi:TolB-like protein/tetratricopeptide (TPR) repeat protein